MPSPCASCAEPRGKTYWRRYCSERSFFRRKPYRKAAPNVPSSIRGRASPPIPDVPALVVHRRQGCHKRKYRRLFRQRRRWASAFPCMDSVFFSPKTCPDLKNTRRRKTTSLRFTHCCISQATAESLSILIKSLFTQGMPFRKRKTSPSRHMGCCPAYDSVLIPGLTVPFMR